MQKYLPSILGPAFHRLFPTSRCMRRPKLTSLVSFFTYLSLAYNKERQFLLNLWAHYKATNDGSEALVPIKMHLENLVVLFEFCLPTVNSRILYNNY